MKLASLCALSVLVTLTSTSSATVCTQADTKGGPAVVATAAQADTAPVPKRAQQPPVSRSSALAGGVSIGTSYCTSVRNSVGQIADLSIIGSAVASQNSVALYVSGLPSGSFSVFITSRYPATVFLPIGSSGNLCVRRDVGRFSAPSQVKLSGLVGTTSLDTTLGEWTTQAIPRTIGTYQAMAGTRTHFQLWYRDNIQGVPTSNFSDAEYVDWL